MTPLEIRHRTGLSLRAVARLVPTTQTTLRLYEADPLAIANGEKRKQIAALYEKLRVLPGGPPCDS